MIHGGIGYLTKEYLKLPIALIDPLSVIEDSKLSGRYYPPHSDYEQNFYSHDLSLHRSQHDYGTKLVD